MAAGIATVRRLKRERNELYPALGRRAAALSKGISQAAVHSGIAVHVAGVESMFTWFFRDGEVWNYDDAAKSDTALFARFHRGMLERGIYLPPSQFEAAFLSTAHRNEDIERTIEAVRETFATLTKGAVTSPS
jgi:glutamate-1-semialdehyde 2,1-aminomutase